MQNKVACFLGVCSAHAYRRNYAPTRARQSGRKTGTGNLVGGRNRCGSKCGYAIPPPPPPLGCHDLVGSPASTVCLFVHYLFSSNMCQALILSCQGPSSILLLSVVVVVGYEMDPLFRGVSTSIFVQRLVLFMWFFFRLCIFPKSLSVLSRPFYCFRFFSACG